MSLVSKHVFITVCNSWVLRTFSLVGITTSVFTLYQTLTFCHKRYDNRFLFFFYIGQFPLELVDGLIIFRKGQTVEEVTSFIFLQCWKYWQIRWMVRHWKKTFCRTWCGAPDDDLNYIAQCTSKSNSLVKYSSALNFRLCCFLGVRWKKTVMLRKTIWTSMIPSSHISDFLCHGSRVMGHSSSRAY